ncbi:sulfite exporter TauE/SafE family protein [Uliginosibacterium sp. sgz301328]|uniref:sulfite exporter TauE/SafE family protein n=1 Tax=Uliginosibacterium sp. sgz301328 TaxID=3243764 RepID=UPI00359E38D3
MDFLTPAGWAVTVIAVLLTGVSKSAFGGALGGIGVPLMAIWLPPGMAVAVMLPILCLMDCFGVRAYWKKWSVTELKIIIPGGLVGIVLGALAIGLLPDRMVKGVIGAIAVLFMLDRLLGLRARLKWDHTPGPVAGGIWSAVSGITSTLAHAGGPPILVYLLGRGLPKQNFVATSAVFFTVVNAAKIAPYIALGLFSRDTLKLAAVLAPLAPIGVWLGLHVLRRVPERPFYLTATALLGLSGAKLLWDALV